MCSFECVPALQWSMPLRSAARRPNHNMKEIEEEGGRWGKGKGAGGAVCRGEEDAENSRRKLRGHDEARWAAERAA